MRTHLTPPVITKLRTKSAYKRHILPRSHPHFKTGYALENQTVFELTGMRRKRLYFLPASPL